MTVLVNGVPDSRKVDGQPLTSDVFNASIPVPDVWIPLTSDLRMITGYGDKILSGTEEVATKATFSRASTGTYIDRSGNMRTAAINEPRFEKEGLLIEGQSTNLISNSTTPISATDIAFSTGSSFGDFNLTKYTHTYSGVERSCNLFGQTNSYTGGTTYVASIYFRSISIGSGGPILRLRATTDTGAFYSDIRFSLPNLTLSNNPTPMGVISWETIHIREGIYKVIVNFTPVNSGTMLHWNFVGGTSGSEFEVGMPQIEAQPVATSYIPTNGSTVTRAADSCTIPIQGNFNWTSPNTFACNCNMNSWPIGNVNNVVSANDRRGFYQCMPYLGANTRYVTNMFYGEHPRVAYGDASFLVADKLTDKKALIGHVFDGSTVKLISDSKITESQSCVTTVGGPTSGTLIRLGAGAGNTETTISSRVLNGHIKNFRIWFTALSDAQAISLR